MYQRANLPTSCTCIERSVVEFCLYDVYDHPLTTMFVLRAVLSLEHYMRFMLPVVSYFICSPLTFFDVIIFTQNVQNENNLGYKIVNCKIQVWETGNVIFS